MRGEHWSDGPAVYDATGSSPHARGARLPNRGGTGGRRLIPACAGSTELVLADGERASGSSPHARGAPPPQTSTADPTRLIPACAGSTTSPMKHELPRSAHPRMRGEHRVMSSPRPASPGSSPHARGAPHLFDEQLVLEGLIPACAGSTRGAPCGGLRAAAHPRMRGEHLNQDRVPAIVGGSSPHARGALREDGDGRRGTGLIPACAGSTGLAAGTIPRNRAHPRMRGEHLLAAMRSDQGFGSSPHARGAPEVQHSAARELGLIPACAGSTFTESARTVNDRAHPRMRGEHCHTRASISPAQGSSPHARGARDHRWRVYRRDRLIPACAGSTQGGITYECAVSGSSPHARGAPQCSQTHCSLMRLIPACAGSTGEVLATHTRNLGSSPHVRGAHEQR